MVRIWPVNYGYGKNVIYAIADSFLELLDKPTANKTKCGAWAKVKAEC
jgi:hypothetical protein